MRCDGCGNELPAWANGVCHVCGRIRREERRFGAHPSARKRARQAPAPPSSQTSNAGSGGSGITLPPWLTSFERSGHCPICGQDVPQDRLEEHIELHTRLRRGGVSARARPAGRSVQQQAPKSAPSENAVPEQTPLQVSRRAVNRLLEDIYRKKYLLSDILRKGGISQADITRIHEKRLREFCNELLAMWGVAFAGELASGAWYIITRSYGLDGVPPAPVERLAQELGLAQKRANEILAETLSVLRVPASREHLESMTITVALQELRSM